MSATLVKHATPSPSLVSGTEAATIREVELDWDLQEWAAWWQANVEYMPTFWISNYSGAIVS